MAKVAAAKAPAGDVPVPLIPAEPPPGVVRRKWGRGHTYRIDGLKVPGVTTITGYFKSGGLAEYPGKVTAEYAVNNWETLAALPYADRLKALYGARWADRDALTGRGTEIHRIGSAIAAGETDVPYPDELAGHVESYTRFLDTLEPKLAAPPELVVGNRAVRYCGAVDLIADLPEIPWDDAVIAPARWLLDVKTGRSGIWPETALQLCGYQHAEVFVAEDGAERPMSWLGVERCGAVHVRGDGWDLVPVDTGPDTWAYFQYLAWLYHQEETKKEWVGIAAGPFPDPTAASGS